MVDFMNIKYLIYTKCLFSSTINVSRWVGRYLIPSRDEARSPPPLGS